MGLVCALYVDFSTSTDAMRWHSHVCKSIAATEDNDWEEEEHTNDNDGNGDDKFLLMRPNQLPEFGSSHFYL